MPIEMCVSGSDPDKASGDWLTEESDSIFHVDEFLYVPDGGGNRHILIDATVSASTVPGQIGKKVKKQKFYIEKVQNKIFGLACALALYTEEQWRADVKAGISPTIDFENCIGRHFGTPVRRPEWGEWHERTAKENLEKAKMSGDHEEIQKREKILAEKRPFLQIGGDAGFTFWSIGDPDADHIPLTPADLAMFPNGLPTRHGTHRKRGTSAGAQMPRQPMPQPGTQVNRPAAGTATQPAAAAAVSAPIGGSFF